MRCLLVLMGLHALWFLGALCALCILARSKEAILYHGLGTKTYLESKGLGVMDVGTALVIYEACGFFFMLLFWGGCWAFRPLSAGFLQPVVDFLEGRHKGAAEGETGYYEGMVAGTVAGAKGYYEGVVAKASDKFGWVGEKLGLDPARLTTSFAEGAVCRSLLKPILLPLKLYVAYTVVVLWKQQGGLLVCPWGAAAAAVAAGTGAPSTAVPPL